MTNQFSDTHSLISTLIEASVQAYNGFDRRAPTTCQRAKIIPPAGYELVDHWSGIDGLYNHEEQEEIYGLVFRSVTSPYRYIFSFRGTDSLLDTIDDLGTEHAQFKTFDSAISVKSDIRVEAGFFNIYTRSEGKKASMQEQLFDLVRRIQRSDKPISSLYITGHSLGAALSTLFAVEAKLNYPDLHIIHVNFASPRVGNAAFAQWVSTTFQAPDQSLRIVNVHDLIPKMPPEELGYLHTTQAYFISFYKKESLGKLDYLENHSSLNYKATIAADPYLHEKQTIYVDETKTTLEVEPMTSEPKWDVEN